MRLWMLLVAGLTLSFGCIEKSTADDVLLIPFHNGQSAGFMDSSGKTVIEPKFQATDQFREGLAAVRSGDLWGFIDESGKLVIDHKYYIAMGFNVDGISRVETELGLWGAIDKTGKEIIPAKYDLLTEFKNGFAFVKEDGLIGVIKADGTIMTPPKFDDADISSFTGPVRYKSGDLWGYFDPKTGQEITPAKYVRTGSFLSGLARVSIVDDGTDPAMAAFMIDNHKIGFIDETGKEVIPLIYDFRTPKIQEGPIKKVTKGEIISFFDQTGKKLCDIPDGYYAGEFVDGYALYRSNKRPLRFGYIDDTCKVVLKTEFESLSEYEDIITFEKDGKSGFMDRDFKVLKSFSYDHVSTPDKFGFMTFRKRSRYGILNSDYEVILKPKYEFIYGFRSGVTTAFDDKGNIFLINQEGKTVAGPIRKDHTLLWYDDFMTIPFCGKRYAISTETGKPIGFSWKEYKNCEEE